MRFKRVLALFVVFTMALTTLGTISFVSVSAETTEGTAETGTGTESTSGLVKAMYDFEDMDTIAQTEYSDWYEVTKMTAATDESGETVNKYTYGNVEFGSNRTSGAIAQSRYVVPKATATETSFESPTAAQMPYRNLQGKSGFKNVTVYHTASDLTTKVSASSLFHNSMRPLKDSTISESTFWYTWDSSSKKFNNLNLIVNPVKGNKIDFGFKFYVNSYRTTTNKYELKCEKSAEKAGGFGEIADSSKNGEYYGGKYNSDDKIVKARLDEAYGYAVYDETLVDGVAKGWKTIATTTELGDKETDGTAKWHSIKYRLDPTKKTYTVYLDGEDKGTFPFSNADSIKQIDAIQFNCMKNNSADAYGTSAYGIDDVYAIEAPVTVKFVDEGGKLIEEKNVQAGDKVELPVVSGRKVTASTSDMATLEAVPDDMTVVVTITAELVNAMYDFEDMDSIVQTEYRDWYEVTKMTAATDESGETVNNYKYSAISFSEGGTRGIAQSRYVVPKATATETSFVSPDADQKMPYRNLQGKSGFKNVTVYKNGAELSTSVSTSQLFHNSMGPTNAYKKLEGESNISWYTWYNTYRHLNNLNLIVNPVKEHKIDFGFNFYVREYTTRTSKYIDSPTKAGGFGEIADSSINGEYYGSKYNSDDKIVKARLDKAYGYAVYDETLVDGVAKGWTTIATADDLGTDAWHSIKYRLDPTTKTYTVYLDGKDKGTFPFSNAAKITQIDAIEFNCMGSTVHHTSNYAVDDVYAIEVPVEITENMDANGAERTLIGDETVTISGNGKLRNAVINTGASGSVQIGNNKVTGIVVFDGEGRIDVAPGNTIKIEAPYTAEGAAENATSQGFVTKQTIDSSATGYTMHFLITDSRGETAGTKTKDYTFDFGGVSYSGNIRFRAAIYNIPEGVTISVTDAETAAE